MTVAVCLQCGSFKHGAFTACPECHYTPDDDESLTKHLVVSDHHQSREQLEAISRQVKAGHPVNFNPESLQQVWVSKDKLDADMKQMRSGCLGIVAVLSAAVGVALWFFW